MWACELVSGAVGVLCRVMRASPGPFA
jgi:hypothetical protein